MTCSDDYCWPGCKKLPVAVTHTNGVGQGQVWVYPDSQSQLFLTIARRAT